MKKTIALLLSLILCIGIFAGCENGGDKQAYKAPEGFSVGYSKADITPDLSLELGLVGTNNEKERIATGVVEPLYASCVAITDEEGNTVILFGTDLLHTATYVTMAVRERITEETGIEGKFVQFTASHNHSGPGQVAGYGFANTDKYNEFFIDQCVKAATEALLDRKPATMSTTFTRTENLNYKRYYVLKDGTYVGRTGGYTQDDLYAHTEKADNLLQLVKFTREGGRDVALINWQAHYKGGPTTQLNYSSDYFGVMRRLLLEQAGCESVFLLGASGDLACNSEISTERDPNNTDYVSQGTALANIAMKAMENMTPAQTGKVCLEENIFHIDTNPNDYYLYTFGVGEIGFVMAPYEMYQSNGMDIRHDSPYKMTMIGTLANASDNNFYLPNADAYDIPNAYGISEKYVKGDAEKFHEQYINMLNACFEAGGQQKQEKAEGYVTDRTPKTDGVTYTNPNPGDKASMVAVNNGHYQVKLVKNSQLKTMLALNAEVAQKVIERSTMELLLDERDIITGVVEN